MAEKETELVNGLKANRDKSIFIWLLMGGMGSPEYSFEFRRHANISLPIAWFLSNSSFFLWIPFISSQTSTNHFSVSSVHTLYVFFYYVLQAEGLRTFSCKELFQSIPWSWKAFLLSTEWPNRSFSSWFPYSRPFEQLKRNEKGQTGLNGNWGVFSFIIKNVS